MYLRCRDNSRPAEPKFASRDRTRHFRVRVSPPQARSQSLQVIPRVPAEAAAKLIGVCNMTALRMLRRGDIKGRQACAGAPWVIKAENLAGFLSRKRPSDRKDRT